MQSAASSQNKTVSILNINNLIYVVAFLVGLGFCSASVSDPDLGWHLLGGSWTVSHGSVPTSDMINAFNDTWVDYHWLSQVILFLFYRVGGYDILPVLFGLLGGYLSIVLVDIIVLAQEKKGSPLTTILLYAGSIAVIQYVSSIRPQAISLLIIALVLRRLLQPKTRSEPFYIFLLCVVCVNIHVYWVFIPFLWFLFRCVPAGLEKSSPSSSVGIFLLLIGAGFISPYGGLGDTRSFPTGLFTNYTLIFDYVFGSSELKTYINEFKSALASQSFLPWMMLLYLCVVSASLRWEIVKRKIPEVILAGLFFVLAVRTLKFVALFAVCGLPLAAITTADYFYERFHSRLLGTITVAAAMIMGGYGLYNIVVNAPYIHERKDELSQVHPIEACKFIAHLNPPISPLHKELRVLTYFDYGGWCRWAMYQENPALDVRVTTDGRTQFVPFEHYQLSFDLYKLQYDWANTLARWNPDVALVQKRFALAQFMIMAPSHWKLMYEDETFAVFIPV